MREQPRILLAGGGTGGHLYPGLAVAEQLRALAPGLRVAFVATRRPIDRQLLEREPCEAHYEDARSFSPKPWTWPAFGLRLMSNLRRARAFLETFRPHAVVGVGGFGSYAPVLQAQKMGLPTFVLNPDLVVGRANRSLARQATAVFCQFAETLQGLRSRGRLEVVGCPIRASLFGVGRREACEALALDPDRKTLVVTGASLGARTVNRAVAFLADRFRHFDDWQVLHLTGKDLFEEVAGTVGAGRPHYRILDYVDAMGQVYAVADLLVSRAGAGTVAEITGLGVASVLVPYPFHRDRHQERHARLLEEAGAAVAVLDRVNLKANAEALWRVLPLLMENAERRSRMAEAARQMGQPGAARSVALAVLGEIGWQA